MRDEPRNVCGAPLAFASRRRGLQLQRWTRDGIQAAQGGRTQRTDDLRGGNEGATEDGCLSDARLEETCVLACGGRWGRGNKGLPGGATTFKNASHSTQLQCDLTASAAVRLFFAEVEAMLTP